MPANFRIFNPQIFKAYDIRGEWNKDWDKEVAYQIGKALVHQFKPKKIVLGQDVRPSSEEIFFALTKAFLEENLEVFNLGLCATELIYFASSFLEVDLAIMITASHNPSKDNGLKIVRRNALSLGLTSGLVEIKQYVLKKRSLNKFSSHQTSSSKERGVVQNISLWEEYQKHVFNLFEKITKIPKKKVSEFRNKKIVLDAGNGMGGLLFDKILGNLNFDLIKLFWQPEGTFPHHLPDPLQEDTVSELKNKVKEEKADLGIAYDGDADRVFFVDETGRYLPGYYLAALFIDYRLKKCSHPEKEIIIYDPRYCWATQETILKHRAKPLMSPVGHTLIKAKMREVNSLFSVESSGHIFYRENHFAESSMLSTLLMLALIEEQGPLGKIADPLFQEYFISGEINFQMRDPEKLFVFLKKKYASGEINQWDGLSITFPDWRFNLRCSHTQPLVRLNLEAKTKELVKEKVRELKEIIKKIDQETSY